MMTRLITWAAATAIMPCLATFTSAEDVAPYLEEIDKVNERIDAVVAQGPYKAEFEDLARCNPLPEWYQDAKFGIYWHWGVYAVPAHGNEWYPRRMHADLRKYHEETHGPLPEYPYHKFVPQFKAEKFDADEWADLFVKAGARYAGPVAEHHDGFSMWKSAVTPWNVGNMGPKRDIAGELEKAIRKRGMKYVVTFHHAFNGNGYYPTDDPAWATASDDPYLQFLYGKLPKETFHKLWQAKLAEVIDATKPDLIWFDSWLDRIPEEVRARFGAYYLNRAAEWGKEVVITRKQGDLPLSWSVEDFEKGRAAEIRPDGFLTDDTISTGSWCFTDNLGIKSSDTVIDGFIDLVSKNGCLLLNISPKADGTIPDDQRKVLLDIGAWLGVNGEAIFETRPWETFGEGPTRLKKGGHFIQMKGPYKPEDIRYTRSKDGKTLYAIVLGTPQGKLALKSVRVENADGSVELLGRGKVPFTVEQGKITIDCPKEWPTDWAHAFKLSGFKFSLDKEAAEEALAGLPGAKARLSTDLVLEAAEAGLKGGKLRLEGPDDNENIGYWDNADEQAVWKVAIPKPGEYQVVAEIACPGTSKLIVATDEGKSLIATIPNTGSYQKRRTVELGTLRFGKGGVHTVIARPASKDSWQAINLWKLILQ